MINGAGISDVRFKKDGITALAYFLQVALLPGSRVEVIKIIQDGNFVALAQQNLRDMRSDKTSAAGN
jgi:hypothetical protein